MPVPLRCARWMLHDETELSYNIRIQGFRILPFNESQSRTLICQSFELILLRVLWGCRTSILHSVECFLKLFSVEKKDFLNVCSCLSENHFQQKNKGKNFNFIICKNSYRIYSRISRDILDRFWTNFFPFGLYAGLDKR